MRMRFAALCLLLAIAACRRPPTDEVTIDFRGEGETVAVTAVTAIPANPSNEAMRRRYETARAAALANTDAWAVRFARVRAAEDSATFHRERGTLTRVTRTATIPPDDLQLLFADANITVKTFHGDGWRELAFFPGSSTRATREQQRQFDAELMAWSREASAYFRAVHDLYRYLEHNPGRARWLFAAVFSEQNEDGTPVAVLEEETPLVEAVQLAMSNIADRMDAREGEAETIDEEADLIFNPFPARVVIRTPGSVLSSEGFTATNDGAPAIEPIDLYAMLTALEGKWISPDPLAALLRDEKTASSELADAERRSTALVTDRDIANELRARLQRPKSYVVRWRE